MRFKVRFFQVVDKQIKVYDADTSLSELVKEFSLNFLYAFIANISVPLIVNKYDYGVFISYIIYYYFLSYILNRDKYNTKLGRYVILPVPCILGAFLSYKIGYILVDYIL